jgi:hypothetical protein
MVGMDEKRTRIIIAICLLAGTALGYMMGETSTGLLVGFLASLGLTGAYRRKVSLSKAQRRIVVTIAFVLMLSVGVGFGLLTGDYVSGLGSAIALSFVIVLKMERLFDERIGSLFSKASRDGFVAVNLSLAALLFASRLTAGESVLPTLSFDIWLLLIVSVGWVIFLFSATYHAYVKGE